MMETGRILLRTWREGDAGVLYRHASDPEVGPQAGWAPHRSEEESREIIRTLFSNGRTWAIVLKDSGEPAGCIGYYTPDESNIGIGPRDAEVGFWVARPYWNRGIATEALQLLTDYCFRKLGFQALWADCFPDNRASWRVMQKCGFRDAGRQNLCSRLAVGSGRRVRVMRLEAVSEEHVDGTAATASLRGCTATTQPRHPAGHGTGR